MKRDLIHRRSCLAGAALVIAVLLFVHLSSVHRASAQSGSGESSSNSNRPTRKKQPAKQPAAKKLAPKQNNPNGNSNTSQSANAAATERTFWESIRNSTDPGDFRTYLKEYPNGTYVTLATNRLNSLQAAANSSRTNTAGRPPASTTSAGKPFRNRNGIEMVWIPPGSFDMGSNNGRDSEKPVHRVTISQGFYIGKYEVTQEQWQSVMGTNPSTFKGTNLPVEMVSWNDAQDFINKLNEIDDRYNYRLPTEAEWEYACRAGTSGDYYSRDVEDIGWCADNSGNKTHKVGSKQANAFGVYDTSGNVWEWCIDWYVDTYEGAPTDGGARLSGGEMKWRVLRGGSWRGSATGLRSRTRVASGPDYRGISDLGFRLVAVMRTP